MGGQQQRDLYAHVCHKVIKKGNPLRNHKTTRDKDTQHMYIIKGHQECPESKIGKAISCYVNKAG